MIQHLKITVLVDDYVIEPSLLGEHGLSMLIEADERRILFDTGQSRLALRNAETLGISLAGLDALVLSHGHYDHTGGLADVLQEHPPGAVFLHPAAAAPKYARGKHPPPRQIGMPESCRQALNASHVRIVWTSGATEIVPGVWCTGAIPRVPGNSQAVAGFYCDAGCGTPDPLEDDQALYMETPEGLVIVAGCTHSGIVNTLEGVCALTGCSGVFMLAGGFHLGPATRDQLDASARALERLNCRILAPCHCTGMNAHAYLRARFPELVRDTGVGTRIALGRAEKP